LLRLSSDPAELQLLEGIAATIDLDGPAMAQAADSAQPSVAGEGLAYRMPAYARLVVSPLWPLGAKPAYEGMRAVPQLGRIAYLPLRNGPFQDNSLAVVFGASGQLQKLTFDDKAAAERAALAARSVFDGYLEFVKGRAQDARDEQSAQLDLAAKRRDAQLDALKDRLETLNTLNALEKARTGSADKQQREIDTLTAAKQRLQLELEIKKLQDELAKLSAP
jgi:hypothetical protein